MSSNTFALANDPPNSGFVSCKSLDALLSMLPWIKFKYFLLSFKSFFGVEVGDFKATSGYFL